MMTVGAHPNLVEFYGAVCPTLFAFHHRSLSFPFTSHFQDFSVTRGPFMTLRAGLLFRRSS
jgi:hypothetical protein